MDVNRAVDLYAQGRTLRQIGAELGVHWSTVSQRLQSAGITMRRGGPPAHPASTQLIVELRDQGLTWPEIAEQLDMGWRIDLITPVEVITMLATRRRTPEPLRRARQLARRARTQQRT